MSEAISTMQRIFKGTCYVYCLGIHYFYWPVLVCTACRCVDLPSSVLQLHLFHYCFYLLIFSFTHLLTLNAHRRARAAGGPVPALEPEVLAGRVRGRRKAHGRRGE